MRKGAAEMHFKSCASRILTLNDYENLHKQNPIKTQKHFQIKNGVMKMTSIKTCQFARLNDKRYFF